MVRSPLRAPLALLCAAAFARPALAQRDAAHHLDTLRVTSRTGDAAVPATRSVEVLTRDDIERHAARSLSDVLALAVGADAQQRSPAQADFGLRGSTYNQVVVLVDGVRVSDVQSGHYAFDLAVPLGLVERVEILRGTGSALYGSDAIGGVVNIVTRADSSFREVATRAGSFGGLAGRIALGDTRGGTALRLGADVDRSTGHRDGTDYTVAQLRGTAERAVGDARVALDAGYGARDFGAADFYSPFPSFENTRSTTAALRASVPLSALVTLSGAAQARRHSDVFTLKRDDPAFYQNRHLSWQSGAEGSARLAFAPWWHAALGGELFDARLRSARLGHHVERRRALFAETTVERDGATLNAGVRGDWSPVVGGLASPSLGVALPVGRAVQLRASTGRGFRAPGWTERYYVDPSNVADSTLGAERFIAHEVGVRLTPVAWASADVALFERRATSLVDWARPADAAPSEPWRTQNFARATYRGIEASIRAPRLAGVDWTLRGSGLRFDAGAAPGTVGKYALRPLTRSFGVTATSDLGELTTLTIDADRARRAGEPDHDQVAARIERRLGDVRLSLEALNLTNSRYLDVSGKPVAPRSAFVGLSWRAP
ncbi:MAG TPA: TonB-dependent receptor [Gemmatimonadaceae bacterium]|jgi:iron complex outermembrane receptor protein|nr:TonB-dependent receptor [Gemmatimonadaceae bacterium]